MNLRLKFNELHEHLADKTKKTHYITQYYGSKILCESDINGYFRLECLSPSCENNDCKVTPMFDDSAFKKPQKVTYDQFVTDTYTYLNENSEKKEGKRTIRKQFSETFDKFKAEFDGNAKAYLLHRYEIINDAFVWPQIRDDSSLGYVFHQDYSENITCIPKYEPQDAHFLGKQTSLHCTVIYPPNEQICYGYHLSDDKKHDSIYTQLVTTDLLDHFPDTLDYPLLRIKSDNCGTQYCCRFVFESYLKLSKQIDKPIILYYGINGHRKGLVDAMSGFGVKSPLRRAIVTNDFLFNTAEELELFLKETFKDDDRKYYKTISSDFIEQCHKTKGIGVVIDGCQKARMISLFPNGDWQIKRHLCNCKFCIVGEFTMCQKDGECIAGEENDDFDLLDEMDNNEPEMFIFIECGSYIALYSDPKSFELFYIVKEDEKDLAEDDKIDIYGHVIQNGANYIKGVYLEKVDEIKGKVFYKQLTKTVYMYPAEVFCPSMAMNENGLYLHLAEYQFLADSV